MARYKGIFEISGSIGDLTFYSSKDGLLVRGKRGVSGERIKTDPVFKGTRKNSSEFGHVSKCGQLIRQSLGAPLQVAKDFRTHSRMTSVLNKVKNLDQVSVRGERKVRIGLDTEAGKELLAGFDFNAAAPFDRMFLAPYSLNSTTGSFEVADFSASKMVQSPKEATHIELHLIVNRIDFDSATYTSSPGAKTCLKVDSPPSPLLLAPKILPAGNGFLIFCFFIQFFQDVNGERHLLDDPVLSLLGVG